MLYSTTTDWTTTIEPITVTPDNYRKEDNFLDNADTIPFTKTEKFQKWLDDYKKKNNSCTPNLITPGVNYVKGERVISAPLTEATDPNNFNNLFDSISDSCSSFFSKIENECLKDLEKENDKYTSLINLKDTEIKKLRGQHNIRVEEIEHLNHVIPKLWETINHQLDHVANQKTELAKLNKEISIQKEKIETFKKELNKVRQNYDTKLHLKITKINELSQLLEIKERRIHELESKNRCNQYD